MTTGKIVVYGGRGALGTACVNHFKLANWWVANVDFKPNLKADYNITVSKDSSWVEQEQHVMTMLNTSLQGKKLQAVICVAGGWAGGNASESLSKQADLMWRQSVWSSSIATTVATKHLSEGGLLALTGAKAALTSTPHMIGYGMAKTAVHQLVRSLSTEDSGLPKDSFAVGLLPIILDTELNRKMMPKANFESWTPLTFVTYLLDKWVKGKDRPPNGSLAVLVTNNNETRVIVPASEYLSNIDTYY